MVGLTKLQIPLKKDELSLDGIIEYLPTVVNSFIQNSGKIRANYEIYKGAHDILAKQRPFEDDSAINNKVVEQYLWEMVNFKCGYIYGNPLEFAEKGTAKTAEMQAFNDYLVDSDFRSKMDSVAEFVYTTGVGYLFVEPQSGETPYKTIFVESDRAAKVYSSYLDGDPLFDLILTPIKKQIDQGWADYYILSVYTENEYYEFEYNIGISILDTTPTKVQTRRDYKLLPLIEFCAYRDKIGIVESCLSLQNALDVLDSASIDNIEDFVNQMLIILNAGLGKTNDEKADNLRAAKKNGVMVLFDPNKDNKADVKTITLQLRNSDVNTLKNQIKADMFGAWGVPLSGSSISSGNVTQGGAEATNGWENAYNVALKENNNMSAGINEFIKKVLWILTNTPDLPIRTLKFKDIDVKFNIARSNNLQVKTQSFSNLVEHNVPNDIAWATCELSGDPVAIGKRIDEFVKAQTKLNAQQQANKGNNSGNADNTGDSEVDGKTQKSTVE